MEIGENVFGEIALDALREMEGGGCPPILSSVGKMEGGAVGEIKGDALGKIEGEGDCSPLINVWNTCGHVVDAEGQPRENF